MKNTFFYFIVTTTILLFSGCGTSSPLEKIKKELDQYPEYTIILEDMKEDGNFFTDYYHRYKTVYGRALSGQDSIVYETNLTDWEKVSKKEFHKNANYLGMVLASRSANGEVSNNQHPPGYQYVGNQQYGQWRTGANGSSFWEFYGKYALISSMFNMFSRPIYRNDYDSYRNHRSSGSPYYGRNREYGTYGTETKKSNPTFFQRKQAAEASRKRSFSDKVKNRTRKSNMSRSRSRSSGFGK